MNGVPVPPREGIDYMIVDYASPGCVTKH